MTPMGGSLHSDRRIGQPTITVGAGRENPQGAPVTIPRRDRIVEGWRELLSAIEPAECAWWSPHVWASDYSRASDWIAAHAAAIDLDYEDPRLPRGKAHVEVPREAWADLYSLAMDGDLPCNLLHSTPRGARAIVVFDRVTTTHDEIAAALRAAAASITAAIAEAGLERVPSDHGGKVIPGFVVDRACLDLKRIFWAPRAIVNGQPRIAEVHIVNAEPACLDELVASAPSPEIEASPTAGTGPADETYVDAARRWCADHPLHFDSGPDRRTCPACGHRDCFGPCPERSDRWFCFSANHAADSGGCGARSKTQPDAYWGDALDLEAHRLGMTPRDVLRADGYLAPPNLLGGIDLSSFLNPGGSAPETTGSVDGITPQSGAKAGRYTVLDIDDALALQAPPSLVRKLIREKDIAVLYGQPGSKKSFVVISMALSIATGTPWLGLDVCEPAPVLYIAGEGTYGVGKRVLAWAGGAIKSNSPIRENWRQINDFTPFLEKDEFPKLMDTILHMDPKPKLIIVDTLAVAMTGGDENSSKDMGLFVHRCKEIRKRSGAAVLLVHHSGKQAGSGERGHSSLKGAVDVMMQLEREEGSDLVTLTVVKTKDEAAPEPIAVEFDHVTLGVDDEGETVSSLRARLAGAEAADGIGGAPLAILGHLRGEPIGAPWVSFSVLRETLGLTRKVVGRAVRKLEDMSLVMVQQKGQSKLVAIRRDQDPAEAE